MYIYMYILNMDMCEGSEHENKDVRSQLVP